MQPEVQETSSEVMFTEDEMNEIVKKRLGKESRSVYKKLGVEDLILLNKL